MLYNQKEYKLLQAEYYSSSNLLETTGKTESFISSGFNIKFGMKLLLTKLIIAACVTVGVVSTLSFRIWVHY